MGTGPAKNTVLQSVQGSIKHFEAPLTGQMSKLGGEDGSLRTHSSLAAGLHSNHCAELPGQGSSGLKPAAGFITGTRGGGCHHHGA